MIKIDSPQLFDGWNNYIVCNAVINVKFNQSKWLKVTNAHWPFIRMRSNLSRSLTICPNHHYTIVTQDHEYGLLCNIAASWHYHWLVHVSSPLICAKKDNHHSFIYCGMKTDDHSQYLNGSYRLYWHSWLFQRKVAGASWTEINNHQVCNFRRILKCIAKNENVIFFWKASEGTNNLCKSLKDHTQGKGS